MGFDKKEETSKGRRLSVMAHIKRSIEEVTAHALVVAIAQRSQLLHLKDGTIEDLAKG